MQKRRVCCYCETWESGGIESFVASLILHMDLSNLEIDIVASRLKPSVFTGRLQAAGVCFYELSGEPKLLFQNSHMLRELFQKRRYHVFHIHVYHGLTFYYLRTAKLEGIPIRIAHSHNTAFRKSKTLFLKEAVHKAARQVLTQYATQLWACSDMAARFLFAPRELNSRGFRFIPNGIDVEKFRYRAEERKQMRKELHCESKLVVGNVGRLCYQKNQEFLLKVFTKINAKYPNSLLLLVGEGEQRKQLEEEADDLGIAKAVCFYGVNDCVEKLLWAMDVFAFPSRFEGLGIVAIEAQAAGLPVVCSDFIPKEALATKHIHSVPLSVGIDAWAKALLEVKPVNRESASQQIRNAGFDIQDVAKMIELEWMGIGGATA